MDDAVQSGEKILAVEKVLAIQGYSYEERQDLLPALATALQRCGGWMLDRRVLSGTTLELLVEVTLCAALELYAEMMQAGLELTRTGHAALTELCQRCMYLRLLGGPEQTLAIRLEVSFPGELPPETLSAHAPAA